MGWAGFTGLALAAFLLLYSDTRQKQREEGRVHIFHMVSGAEVHISKKGMTVKAASPMVAFPLMAVSPSWQCSHPWQHPHSWQHPHPWLQLHSWWWPCEAVASHILIDQDIKSLSQMQSQTVSLKSLSIMTQFFQPCLFLRKFHYLQNSTTTWRTN